MVKRDYTMWHLLTDDEKNAWLEKEGFSIRYPIEFVDEPAKFYFNEHRVTTMSELETEIRLARCHNPRELIPIGF